MPYLKNTLLKKNLEQEAIWINSKYQGQWTSHLVEQVSKESPICWRIWSFILLINTCCMIMKPLLPLLSSLYCRNQAHPGWTASSATWLTSFCWRTLPPSRWRLPSWSKSFQIYGEGFNKLTVLEYFYCNQEASIKTYSVHWTPEGPIFFFAYCYTFTVLFLALSQSKEDVRICICFLFFLSQWIKTRKRGMETYLH